MDCFKESENTRSNLETIRGLISISFAQNIPILIYDLDGLLIDSVHSRDGCAKDFAEALHNQVSILMQFCKSHLWKTFPTMFMLFGN